MTIINIIHIVIACVLLVMFILYLFKFNIYVYQFNMFVLSLLYTNNIFILNLTLYVL